MHRSLQLLNAAAFAGLAFCLAPPARAQAAKPALYTADQAVAGAAVYQASCATCHGEQMEGTAGPALKGPVFTGTANAQSMTAQSLLDVVVNTMPQSDPGTLKPEDYNAVVAYILQQNGYPAGAVPLAPGSDALKNTKITP